MCRRGDARPALAGRAIVALRLRARVAEAAAEVDRAAAEVVFEAQLRALHAEAHAEGKQQGLRLAGVYRDVALLAIGFVVGASAWAFTCSPCRSAPP